MRSIRLSLIVYFMTILGVALGFVSFLVYQTADQVLLAKQEATAALIETQFQDSCQKEYAKLDDALLYQARTLARLAQFQYRFVPYRRQLAGFGPLTSVAVPGGQFSTVLWIAQASRGKFSDELLRRQTTRIKFDEKEIIQHVDGEVAEYFQIKSPLGPSYKSKSLGRRSLPDGPDLLTQDPGLDWEYDVVTLMPGKQVRRVTLSVPANRQVWWAAAPPHPRGEWGRGWDRGSPRPPDEPPNGLERKSPQGFGPRLGSGPLPSPELQPQPTLTIMCACDMARLDAEVARFKEARDQDLAQLNEATTASLLDLRNRLLLISLTCFGLAVVGGFFLVGLGLAPVGRLSEAVSRVSSKDFRLPIQADSLPVELRPIALRLEQTLDALKRLFAREKQAAADISHELRTPLAALLTATEVALKKPRSPEEYREVLEDCRASGKQMGQLVERLLALARLDAGVDTMRPRELDVAALARQCAAMVRPLAEARGLVLSVKSNGPAPYTADPDKLGEVLTNLLHNAIEYNREDGRVDVAVARENGHLKMEVTDTGIGIASEVKSHIFERFYRADASRQSEGLHAGLGLAIVKGYVDMMGGTIDVDSEPGVGSTFRVCLPVK